MIDICQGLFTYIDVCCIKTKQLFFKNTSWQNHNQYTDTLSYCEFWGFYIQVKLLYKLMHCFEFIQFCRGPCIFNEFFLFFFFKGKHCKIIQYFNLQGSGFNRRKHYTSTCITKIMIVFSKYCFSNERVF